MNMEMKKELLTYELKSGNGKISVGFKNKEAIDLLVTERLISYDEYVISFSTYWENHGIKNAYKSLYLTYEIEQIDKIVKFVLSDIDKYWFI